ncbi:MAG: FHA domain-containing protein, partial [Planctomycetes bacterium]|nr:FHA domain-containing protein [Planctomycetota bacterium]
MEQSPDEKTLRRVKEKAMAVKSTQTETQGDGYKLKVAVGDQVEFFDLRDETITIGRAKDNNLTIRDGRSSRHHCKIERCEEGWRVVDVGSQNGTFMNGRRVRRSPLRLGDVVQVGSTSFSIERKMVSEDLSRTRTQTDIKISGDLEMPEGDEEIESDILLRLQSLSAALNSEL